MLQRLRGQAADEDGFSLIEVIVALFIIAIVMSASLAFFINSLKNSGLQSQRQGAVTVTNQALSAIQATDPKTLLGGRAKADVIALNAPADAQLLLDQDILDYNDSHTSTIDYDLSAATSANAVVPLTITPTVAGVQYTVRTFINPCWLDDPTSVCSKAQTATSILVLRVTVATTWTPKAPQTCAGGCLFYASSLVDTQSDPAFKTNISTPTIAGVSGIVPASTPVGSSPVLTINGSGFVAGAVVKIDAAAGVMSATTTNTGSQITVPFAAGNTPGSYTITVVNPDGGHDTRTFVVSPLPDVTSITPSTVVSTGPTTVTINGTNFVGPLTVTASSGTFSGLTLTGGNKIVGTYTPTGSTIGAVSVTVTNADGGSDTGTISINKSVPTITNAVQGATNAVGKPTTIVLTGTNFITGATVTATSGMGTVSSILVTSSTSATITYTPSAASASNTRFTLLNPDGGTAFKDLVVKTAPVSTPTITKLSLTTLKRNSVTTLTVTGTAFETGQAATLTVGGVQRSVLTYSSTTLTFSYTAQNAVTYPSSIPITVTVKNSDGGTATYTWNLTVTN